MLLVAGLLEGFGRQLITNDIVRYVIAGGMGCSGLARLLLRTAARKVAAA